MRQNKQAKERKKRWTKQQAHEVTYNEQEKKERRGKRLAMVERGGTRGPGHWARAYS